MRLHVIQHNTLPDHVAFERWAEDEEHKLTRNNMLNDTTLPNIDDFDWLIILGGIMDTHEEETYPWLVDEKKLIRQAIDANKIVLGICLGAQLVAEVLGAEVRKNEHAELGWHGVHRTDDAINSEVFSTFPIFMSVFQWHYYMFDLPEGAARIFENEAAPNQAFEYNGRVIATQFHPEYDADCIRQLVTEHGDNMPEGPYIQPKEQIMTEHCLLREADALIDLLLTNIADAYGKDYEQ